MKSRASLVVVGSSQMRGFVTNANETTRAQLGEPEGLGTAGEPREPIRITIVLRRFEPMSVDEDVDVRKQYRACRRKGQSLSTEESSRVARIAQVWASALQVWREEEAARAFLFRPHPMLDQRTPVEVAISTDLGARLVEDMLGRLQHGSAA